ncbi:MAG: DUF3071 domain-containing protein [Nocardioidaceae bacterium]|nr:DUF3071 domain-containing protein [Nocardioidaceae bacterium]
MADPADGPGAVPAPAAPLSLAGTSPDGKRLLLVDDHGAEFTLEVTTHLRAIVRGDTTRLGQLEITMSSSIRPREIQSRIRAGESAESVAETAGTTVEAIMAYVGPVLAEREHLAQRALKASLRRTPGGAPSGTPAGSSRALGDAVEGRLRRIEEDPTTVSWDSYRRETGRWVLTATYSTAQRSGVAAFTYDAPGNYALADNDDARWLIGDVTEPAAVARDDLTPVRERRLSAVPSDELPLGDSVDQALDLVADDPVAEADLPDSDTSDEPIRSTAPPPATEDDPEPRSEPAPPRRSVQKKRGRASVPSWDEIMFGGSDQG